MTLYLTLEDALQLIEDLGVGPVRDLGLLASALHRPQTTLLGVDAYPTLAGKAAALLDSLVRNRSLVDGNKQLGWLATAVFLGLNDIWLEAPDGEAFDLVTAVGHSSSITPILMSRANACTLSATQRRKQP